MVYYKRYPPFKAGASIWFCYNGQSVFFLKRVVLLPTINAFVNYRNKKTRESP